MAEGQRSVYRAALAHGDFRWLSTAYAASKIGDFVYTVALVAVVYDATHSAAWVAGVPLATRLPLAVLPALAGPLVDRRERRQLMLALDVGRFALMVALTAAVVQDVHPGPLLVLAAVTACLGAPYSAANAGLTSTLVPESDLTAANAVSGSLEALTFVVAPAAGSVLLLLGPPWIAFAVNALSFLVSAVALTRVRRGPVPQLDPDSPRPSPTAGFRALNSNGSIASVVIGFAAMNFTWGAAQVTLVLVSRDLIGTGTDGVGYLMAGVGVGGFVGSLLTVRASRTPRTSWVVTAALAFGGVGTALWAVFTSPPPSYVVSALLGAAYCLLDALSVTLLQRGIGTHGIGAAKGALDSVAFGGLILGAVVAPGVVAVVGLEPAIVLLAVPAALSVAAILATGPRIDVASRELLTTLAPRLEVLRRVDVLAGAPPVGLERLASTLVEERLPRGRVVLVEGDPPDDVYVVVSGTFGVTSTYGGKAPATPVAELGPGDCFGEMGLVLRRPRAATVRATSDATVYRLPGADFLEVLTGSSVTMSSVGQLVGLRARQLEPTAD